MLKVSPWKGVIRFGKRGKLNPRYIGPFKILAKVGTLAYRLELPEKLSQVHSSFHVLNLKKCFVDEPLAIPFDEIQIDDKLNFIEEPVKIMDREVKQLKQSRIPIVMVAPVIFILSDTSEESVGSHAPRVILFGTIPAIIPAIPEVPIVPADPIVTPKVGTVLVVSPAAVLDLVDYSSSSDSDPLKDSLPPAPDLPLVSPFLCSDDSEADDESEPAEQRPERHESLTVHDAKVSRWRDRVASRPSTPSGPSSHDTLAPSSEFPLAPIVAHLGFVDVQRLLSDLRVRPLPACRLAWRRVSHHSSDHHSSPESSSSSSSSDPSSVHSSACDSSGQAHSGPSTRDVPSRLIYPSGFTPRYSVAFSRWRSAPLSTPYPPTTSESSLGSLSERPLDSSSPSSRPSHKRSPTPADLLPPRKRFRGSYSSEDSGEEHMEVDTADVEAVADVCISEGVVAHTRDGVGMRVEIAASDVREDDEEFEAEASATDTREIVVDPLAIGDSSESSRGGIPDLEDTIYDIVHYMSKVHIDRITDIETTQRRLETSQLVASGERASLVERIGSLRLEYLKEEFRQVRRDRGDTRRRLRRLESYLSCLLKEQLLEPALNLTVHCCGLEFRVLNGYDQKSFDEERGLNCVVQTSFP
ncbi:hypothetical protein Tco_0639748 [Tanacetum coccineum]